MRTNEFIQFRLGDKILFIGVALLFSALDQLTKYVIFYNITFNGSVPVFGNLLHLNHQYNPGISFGALSGLPQPWGSWVFASISFAFIIGISVYALKRDRPMRIELLTYAMLCGGAAGNFFDRIYRGAVLDWISVRFTETYYFPTFNLADAFIVSSVLLLLLKTFKTSVQEKAS